MTLGEYSVLLICLFQYAPQGNFVMTVCIENWAGNVFTLLKYTVTEFLLKNKAFIFLSETTENLDK